ncbi:hypothetical protein JCM11641_000500 [Rhodosporidiobolus odoratus]
MRFATPLFFSFSAVLAVATVDLTKPTPAAVDPVQASALAVSTTEHQNEKRSCLLGILCFGSSTNYDSDVNNCGSANKKCSTSWSNGSGSQCVSGVCFPGTCNAGFGLNSATGQCQSVMSDVNNCGSIGKVCSLNGATGHSCVSGNCVATACGSGYSLASGICNVKIDTTSDVNNCGTLGNKCPSSYSYGSGSKCSAGVCQPNSCNSGYSFSFASQKCVNTLSDASNCGSVGNVCSFANGAGSCSNGACRLTSCSNGFYNINGVCTSMNLQTDVNNCGSVGNVCSYTNGVATCSSGTCSLASCNAGYKLTSTSSFFGLFGSSSSCTAVDTSSDTNNCGAVGKVCTFANGSGKCSSGVCTYTSCSSGFYNINNVCTALDIQSDINNCGSVGNVCSYPNGIATCSSGQCKLSSCQAGYTMSTSYNLFGIFGSSSSCSAINTDSDVNNCGAVGNKCAATYANGGSGTCVSGKCQASCNSGFAWDSSLSYCRDVSCDASNCGSIGNVCSATNGVAKCTSGKCALSSCSSGFKLLNGICSAIDLTSDPNNCGAIGKICPSTYANGGAGSCVLGICTSTCNSGFLFDSIFGYCRDTRSDVNNCGRIGNVCSLLGALTHTCSNGNCAATTCSAGYVLKNGQCTTLNLLADVNNCGSIGNACQFSPSGATGECQSGKCVVTACPAKHTLTKGVCVLGASQAARVKKSKITKPRTLCPAKETACPIAGSSTYTGAVAQHFTSGQDFSGIMAGSGGYECIDTEQALDSCGGCASTGEGRDCTRIRGAQGVGCDAGTCVVFSCASGWKVSLDGSKCVRTRDSHHSGDHNSTSHSSSAKRHLHARAHHGHAASHF